MKHSLRLLALVAFAALPFVGRAQLTYTNSDFSESPQAIFSGGVTAIQTFTGFTNLSSMTWTLQNTGTVASVTNFNAYIAEWDTNTNTAVVGTLQQFQGGFSSLTGIAFLNTGTVTFTDSVALNSSTTYAVMLSYFSGDSTFLAQAGTNPGGAFFGSGSAGFASTSSDLGSFQTDLEGTGGDFSSMGGQAYTLSVDGIAASPAPEPATAAVGIAAAFVSVLVGRRIRQRRALVAAPLAA